jgi:excisionase family DNA binding protein
MSNDPGIDDIGTISKRGGLAALEEFVARYKTGTLLGEPRTWFTAQQAADFLCVAEPTLARYTKEGTAPESVRIGNGRRFHRDALNAWIRNGGIHAFGRGGDK